MSKRNENKKGYKNTKADSIPEGWKKYKLGELFVKRTDRGRVGLPVISVTLNNGLIERNSIERKMDTNLEPEEHLLIKKNDIAYNMMRMWQGASGMASYDGIISPAYIVLKPREMEDPHFAAHWVKSARMIYLFWAYSYGLTGDRLRLYFKDLSLIPVVLPSLPEQKAIACISSTWDLAIKKTEQMISAKEKRFKWLLNQMISQKNMKDEWKRLKLGEVCKFFKGKGLSKEKVITNGKTKCILYGELYTIYTEIISEVKSYTNTREGVASQFGDVLIPALTTTSAVDLANATALLEKGVLLGGDINILRAKKSDVYDPEFFAYYLTHIKRKEIASHAQGITIVHLYGRDLKKIILYLPPLTKQKQIIATLKTVQQEIGILKKLVQAYRQQKCGLMQKLLTGELRVKI